MLQTRLVALSALGAAQTAQNKKLADDIAKTLEEYSSALYSLEYVREREDAQMLEQYEEIMKMSPKMVRTAKGLQLVGL